MVEYAQRYARGFAPEEKRYLQEESQRRKAATGGRAFSWQHDLKRKRLVLLAKR